MSTVKKFIAYDDIRLSQGKEVISDYTLPLTFGDNAVELDLTSVTMLEAMKIPLGELLEMGRPLPVSHAKRMKGPDLTPRRKRRSAEEMVTYKAELREYAKKHGLEVPPEGSQLREYRQSLIDRYEKSLATQVRGGLA